MSEDLSHLTGKQFQLAFPEPVLTLDGILTGTEGYSAIQALRQWQDWPRGFLTLTGPERSGVTSVLKAWTGETDGRYLKPDAFNELEPDDIAHLLETPVALDDADLVSPPNSLLTLLNLAMELDGVVLLGGHGYPAEWHTSPPDLVSRLSSTTKLVMPSLTDELFTRRIRATCLSRFIDLPDETLNYVINRLERSYFAIEMFAVFLDRAMASENKPASIPMARKVLTSLEELEENRMREKEC